jgi:hypothetical protein
VREGIEGWLKTRANYLEHGIRELLSDRDGKGITTDLFNHPLISGLYAGEYSPRPGRQTPALLRRGRNLPSYIPSRSFAMALMDIAAHGPPPDATGGSTDAATLSPGETPFDRLRAGVESVDNPAVKRTLLLAINGADGDVNKVREHLEAWYNNTMDRVSGWYKRSTQFVLFWVALVVVVSMNINTLTIADYLYRHTAERESLVSTVANQSGDFQGLAFEHAQTELQKIHIPLGWDHGWGLPREESATGSHMPWGLRIAHWGYVRIWGDVFQPVVGLLLTTFAAMLGAPFWFDLLSKVTALRSTAKPGGGGAPVSAPSQSAPAPAPAQTVTVVAQGPTPDADARIASAAAPPAPPGLGGGPRGLGTG